MKESIKEVKVRLELGGQSYFKCVINVAVLDGVAQKQSMGIITHGVNYRLSASKKCTSLICTLKIVSILVHVLVKLKCLI